jgi:DNA-binding MarR family transcriptional regulator
MPSQPTRAAKPKSSAPPVIAAPAEVPDPRLDSLRALQRAIAILARRSKDPNLHELIGSRVGWPLGGPYYGTIARIGRAGECTVSELAEFLNLDLSTISRRVRYLEDHGLVKRRTDDRDRRSSRMQLTKKGREVHAALDQGWIEILDQLTADRDDADLSRFAIELEAFSNALEQMGAERRPSSIPSWLSDSVARPSHRKGSR